MNALQFDERWQKGESKETIREHHSPAAGWLAHVPQTAIPYLQLMRLDRPNGYWYFWFPHVFGTLLVAIQEQPGILELARVNAILAWGVLVMRGATCTWNDTVDVNFDRQVSRCKNRPVARGAVSVKQAHFFTAAQAALSLATLSVLPPLCTLYALPAIAGWIGYPLAKRISNYPQVVLGFPMAWGVYMGAASMGADPLGLTPVVDAARSALYSGDWTRIPTARHHVRIDWPIAAFYAANVLWTLLYELVYSHQDAAEDIGAGVKSLVLLYANPTAADPEEYFGTLPLLGRIAVGQVIFLAAAGASGGYSAIYSTVGVAGAAAALTAMLSRVRLGRPASCAWWFKVGNARYVGGAMVLSLVLEYIVAGFRT